MWAKLELSDTSVFKSRVFLLKEISVRSFKANSTISLDVSLMSDSICPESSQLENPAIRKMNR